MKFGQWLGLIAVLISLYILWEIRQVLLLVFLAIVLATTLNRIVRRLKRSGTKRGLAAAIAIGLFLTLFVFCIGLIVPPLVNQFQQLIQLVPQGFERFRAWLIVIQTQIPGSVLQYLPRVDQFIQQTQLFTSWVFNNFFLLFSNAFSTLLSLLLVFVLTIMFLVNPTPYRRGLMLLFPAFYRKRVNEILSLCEVSLVGWIRGILINMTVIGMVSGIGLWLLGVPLPLANAALAGLLEAIPNIGPTLSAIPPMAIALLEAPWKAGAVLLFYLVIQQLEQFLLVPYVMATQVALLPAVTLLSQVIFAIFFGFLGLLLAIPLMIVGQIWIREVLVEDILNPWQHPVQAPRSLEP